MHDAPNLDPKTAVDLSYRILAHELVQAGFTLQDVADMTREEVRDYLTIHAVRGEQAIEEGQRTQLMNLIRRGGL